MNEKYARIINAVHHQSAKHPRMSMVDRAAQFSSFAALTGHGDAIKEEARLVDKRVELNDEEIQDLNTKLLFICDNILSAPFVTVTYFVPDERKDGGAYIDFQCHIKKVDLNERTLTAQEGKRIIKIDDILKITGV